MLDLEVVRDVRDRRALIVGMASNCEQKLVVRRREPGLGRLLSTPPLELAQTRSQFEEPPVVVVRQVVHGVTVPGQFRRRRRWGLETPGLA